jgi:hypothetical protein
MIHGVLHALPSLPPRSDPDFPSPLSKCPCNSCGLGAIIHHHHPDIVTGLKQAL